KYGKLLGGIRSYLQESDGNALKAELDREGKITVTVGGDVAELTAEDLLIETIQGTRYVSLSEGGVTVALDTELTPELIEEGYVREVISKVQTMRKEAGFDVTDHITLYVDGNDKIRAIVDKASAEIKAAVLCDMVVFGATEGYTKEWDINGETVTLAVKK
ncbi:MAG: isoleucine--tRNA ligase, partial [Clostridia bacterium]|nr:isoleucine--tRNA ligase [Clostridia bacterium]